jgi:hypothetical protein
MSWRSRRTVDAQVRLTKLTDFAEIQRIRSALNSQTVRDLSGGYYWGEPKLQS